MVLKVMAKSSETKKKLHKIIEDMDISKTLKELFHKRLTKMNAKEVKKLEEQKIEVLGEHLEKLTSKKSTETIKQKVDPQAEQDIGEVQILDEGKGGYLL